MSKFEGILGSVLSVAILAAGLAACSGGRGGADVLPDLPGDTVAEVSDDAGLDAVADSAPDAPPADAPPADAGSDATSDAADAVGDAPHDVGEVAGDATDAAEVTPPPLWQGIAPTGSYSVRSSIGVSTHMHQGIEPDARRDFEFEKYAELGTPVIREDYHWHKIEPADDQWDLDRVQGQVDLAAKQGVAVIPMLGYEVGWAMTDTSDFSTIDAAEYGEYAGHVAAAYCATIKDYEVWNEENIPRFWGGKPDAAKYGDMLKAAHTAIKASCPDARVAFGGMSSYDVETDLTDRWGFLARVALAHPDICDYFEIVAFHPYTFLQYDPPERDVVIDETFAAQGQSWQTGILRETLAGIGCPDKALMITEQGWPSYDLTEAQVGRFLPRSVLLALRDGVEKYLWYTFWDGYPTTEGVRPHESYFGLFGWTGEDGTVRRAKPAWNAFKALADVLGDTRFARDLSAALGLPNDVYALAFMDDAGAITVAAWDGREYPDQSYGVDSPGGPDTTFDLSLPLPDGFSGVEVLAIDGAVVDPSTYTIAQSDEGFVLQLTLSPAIAYIRFE